MGIGFVALAVFLTTVLILLGMRLITVELWIRRMGAGDLDYQPAIRGKDEVTETARSIEELRQRSIKALQLDLVQKLSEGLKEKNEELEQLVNELQQRQEQIIMRRKLVELGELTAGVAHEIRNPLNFVKNFSEASGDLVEELKEVLEEEGVELSEEQRGLVEDITGDLISNVERISSHGQRADRIVNDMLQMGRGGQEFRPTDINALLDEHARLAYHSARGTNQEFQLDIKEDFDPTVGELDVIPQDIGRVFLNMVSNAGYAAHEKRMSIGDGSIGIGKYMPTLSLHTKREGDMVEIRIGDNGTGMPPDVVEKIFNPFFTTKPTDQGTGLGLAISADIVRRHGGNIRVESEPGEGTEMIIDLPVERPTGVEAVAEEVPA